MIISIGNKELVPDFKSSELFTIYFEGFSNLKYQIIINIKEEGMIIKYINEEKNKFILTKNQIIDNLTISESSNFILDVKISNIKDNKEEDKKANCTMPPIENDKEFTIECILDNDISEEDEIIIIEEPEDEKFYFNGYKNKRTLTLIAGHLEKDNDSRKFMLKNNKFTGEVPEQFQELIFNIINTYGETNIANCSFNHINFNQEISIFSK